MEDSVPKYDLFQKAYKKLKSTAYYDKTNLHLRDRIAEAENTLNITIEERLKDLHQAFVASDSTKWERKKEHFLSSASEKDYGYKGRKELFGRNKRRFD